MCVCVYVCMGKYRKIYISSIIKSPGPRNQDVWAHETNRNVVLKNSVSQRRLAERQFSVGDGCYPLVNVNTLT